MIASTIEEVATTSTPATILMERLKTGVRVDVLDVRLPGEFREVHLPMSSNVPLHRLDPAEIMRGRSGRSAEPLYLICQNGARSRQAYELFRKAGFPNVINVDGGITACVEAGVPLVHGKKAMSLERQVRIAAGSLVLTGVALGFIVQPAFFVVPAFVGAGLVFSGITDTCGMGVVLARMPWNRPSAGVSCCSIDGPSCRLE